MKLLSDFVKTFLVRDKKVSTAKIMALVPPKVPGLTKLDRSLFDKKISVPTITYEDKHNKNLASIIKHLKKFFIKAEKFHAVSKGKIYLNPELIKKWQDLPIEKLKDLEVDSSAFSLEDVQFTYQNWRADELVRAIVPDGIEPATSYSKIGHILHINLKDNLLPYKTAIAEIYMDKTVGCRTIINKAQSIENTFRNFNIDLLLGEADYKAEVKENGFVFEFDFSTVYWNPRLSGEHERLVKMMNANDVFYDVFAGVGPFAVPAGKKRVNVLANDLNPDSYKWLESNIRRNKVQSQVKTSNKDGRDFILEDIKENLLERIKKREEELPEYSIHIAMNLPGLAVTFLNAFVGLLKNNEKGIKDSKSIPTPICHCYCFVKGVEDPKVMAKALVEENIGFKLIQGETLKDISFVRNVAPNKDMMRVDLLLTSEILFDNMNLNSAEDHHEVPCKKQCKKFEP